MDPVHALVGHLHLAITLFFDRRRCRIIIAYLYMDVVGSSSAHIRSQGTSIRIHAFYRRARRVTRTSRRRRPPNPAPGRVVLCGRGARVQALRTPPRAPAPVPFSVPLRVDERRS